MTISIWLFVPLVILSLIGIGFIVFVVRTCEGPMRAYLGHRLPFGFYGGVSIPFHPGRVLTPHGSGDRPPFLFVFGCILLGVVLAVAVLVR